MKRILLFALLLCVVIPSFASWKRAMLRVKHELGRNISIEIDGRRYNKMSRSLTVEDVTPGRHRVRIFKYNTNGHGYSTGKLIYQGMIEVRPGRIYYCIVNEGNLDVEENCCIDDYGHWNQNDSWEPREKWERPSYGQDDDPELSWNNNNSWNQNDNRGNHNNNQGNHSNNQGSYNNNQGNYNDNQWDNYNGQMSEGRFSELIAQIRKASFENSKTSVAKQALKTNRITCKQLLAILNEFSFESTKLQFAKDAYKSVTDKNNYFLINDTFTFQSSKDDLLEFLERAH
ncbi:MAG: hypothetical protein RIQ62_935 [Bacteroidota bacterium]